MESLDIRMDVEENPWNDLDENTRSGTIVRAGFLPEATDQGNPAVFLAIKLDDGEIVVGSTTMALFTMASRAGLARYGEPG